MNDFKGIFTALITPFDAQDCLDETGLRLLIKRQIENGVNGIVFLGTTGETPTLSETEKKQIVEIGKQECSQRTLMIVGTGSYSTKQTIEDTLWAEESGADAALIVNPYYNKPTQEGLYQHFKSIAEATPLPIILYNIQGRTCVNISTETLKRLMQIPTIVGIKEASGNISQISDVIEVARQTRPDFAILSGDDALTLPLMALGGHGIISVIGNLVPKEVVNLVQSLNQKDFESAQWMHYHLMPLIRAAFMETNPIPIKAAMNLCKLPSGHCRLPLSRLSPENALKLEQIVLQYAEMAVR